MPGSVPFGGSAKENAGIFSAVRLRAFAASSKDLPALTAASRAARTSVAFAVIFSLVR